jgi:hypothetical protein
MAKRTVRQNVWGNWRGYEGGRFVREFGNSTTQTAEEAARAWAGVPKSFGAIMREFDAEVRTFGCHSRSLYPGVRLVTFYHLPYDHRRKIASEVRKIAKTLGGKMRQTNDPLGWPQDAVVTIPKR